MSSIIVEKKVWQTPEVIDLDIDKTKKVNSAEEVSSTGPS